MNKFLNMFSVIAIILATAGSVLSSGARLPDVEKMKDGIYLSRPESNFGYMVDTKIQACFVIVMGAAGPVGISQIRCSELEKRPEWQPIINWSK